MQIKAERNALVKSSHGFLCAVDIRHFFRLHVALFMINCRFNNTISYCLFRNNKMLMTDYCKALCLFLIFYYADDIILLAESLKNYKNWQTVIHQQ